MDLLLQRIHEKIKEAAKITQNTVWETEMLTLLTEYHSEIKKEVAKHGKESR